MPAPRDIGVRLLEKLEPVTPGWGGFDECWVFQGGQRGATQPWDRGDHYGSIWYEGRTESPHRLILKLFAGIRLRKDRPVSHTCRNRRCINPAHIRQTTHLRNVLEAIDARGWWEEVQKERAAWL